MCGFWDLSMFLGALIGEKIQKELLDTVIKYIQQDTKDSSKQLHNPDGDK